MINRDHKMPPTFKKKKKKKKTIFIFLRSQAKNEREKHQMSLAIFRKKFTLYYVPEEFKGKDELLISSK